MALEPRGGPWQETLEDGLACVRLLVEAGQGSDLVDEIERRFGSVQGFHPRRWWEADRARKASLLALGIGGVLLAALAALIYFTQR